MTDIKKIAKLVKIANRVETKLPKKARLKLARKRLYKIAGTDDPQEYGVESFVQKDNAKESSEQKDDEISTKRIDNTIKVDDERFVLESKKKN